MSEEPTIVAFLCNWCSYTGADLAGTSRIKYASNMSFILKALSEGADGVLVCGCHPGDCHYQEGNDKALRRHIMLKNMITQFGIEPERVRLEWVSASEGDRFAKIADEFTGQIKKLGPLNWKKSEPMMKESAV